MKLSVSLLCYVVLKLSSTATAAPAFSASVCSDVTTTIYSTTNIPFPQDIPETTTTIPTFSSASPTTTSTSTFSSSTSSSSSEIPSFSSELSSSLSETVSSASSSSEVLSSSSETVSPTSSSSEVLSSSSETVSSTSSTSTTLSTSSTVSITSSTSSASSTSSTNTSSSSTTSSASSSTSGSLPTGQVVVYWGQDSVYQVDQTLEKDLDAYCTSVDADIFIISSVNQFGAGQETTINLANHCGSTTSCPDIGRQIVNCQNAGKKVFISLGGEDRKKYSLSSSEADSFATELWNKFGGGSASDVVRPFGDAVVDGFDLDIEGGDNSGYPALVQNLKSLFSQDSSKSYAISAAPQCPYPDHKIGNVLSSPGVDYAIVQFYNNPSCELTTTGFNWNDWAGLAEVNNFKIFIGLLGDGKSTDNGYTPIDEVKTALQDVVSKKPEPFGGFSVWDVGRGVANIDNGKSYIQELSDLISN